MNDCFFSIISDRNSDKLLVRGRRKGDIEKLFPAAEIVHTPNADYAYRTFLPRKDVGVRIAASLEAISYDNFKNSVRDKSLHHAYSDVWETLATLQTADDV